MSGLTWEWQFANLESVDRETPSVPAARVIEIPNGSR
jgi:hypothetical protein